MSRIENWTTSQGDIDEALQLQAMRKEAGITRPQLARLLELSDVTYMDYERAHARVPPQTMQKIREILDGVKAGKIKPPIVSGEE
jgi:transcriptional regulator with XRE-family HTH domain